MNKELAIIFLKFSNESFIMPILVLGYIWLNRNLFYHGICVTLLAVIYARVLKNYFQIYSPKYGLIFPSGHTLTATATYFWIALKSRKIFIWLLSFLIIVLTCYSMIFFDYHNLNHILGGVFFAIIFIILYNYMLVKYPNILDIILLPLAIFLLLYIKYKNEVFVSFLWIGIYALIGIFIGEKCFPNRELKKKEKLLATLIYSFTSFITYLLFSEFSLPNYLFEIRWFILGITLPSSIHFAKKLLSN